MIYRFNILVFKFKNKAQNNVWGNCDPEKEAEIVYLKV